MSNEMIIIPLITIKRTTFWHLHAVHLRSYELSTIAECRINERKYKWWLHVHHHAHKLSVRELFLKYPLKCVCVEKMHKNYTVLNKYNDHLQHKSAEKRNGWVYMWRQQLDLFSSVCFLPTREVNVVAELFWDLWLRRIFGWQLLYKPSRLTLFLPSKNLR